MKQPRLIPTLRWIGCIALVGAITGGLIWVKSQNRLPAERELCRKAGLPLSVSEWESAHVPASQDSAPDYQAFDAALARHDFTDADEELAKDLSFGHAPTDAEAARLRTVFDARPEVLAALDRALVKPRYSFGKDPDPQAIANELAPMSRRREAVMLVCARGIMLVHSHRYAEGARTAARGFRIGHQIGTISSLIGGPVSAFMDTITSDSLGVILRMAGSDPRAAAAVREALRAAPKRVSPAYEFEQYCGECNDEFRRIRQGDYDAFAASFPYGDPGRFTDPALWDRNPRAFVLRHVPFTYRAMVDSSNAATLRTLRDIIGHADLPYRKRCDWIRTERLSLSPSDPDNAHPRLMLEDFESQSADYTNAVAHRNVVLAAANVLVYRAQTGRLPERLSDTGPDVPPDPFTGNPLQYRRDEKGGFTVSSIGQSAKDIPSDEFTRPPVVFRWVPAH